MEEVFCNNCGKKYAYEKVIDDVMNTCPCCGGDLMLDLKSDIFREIMVERFVGLLNNKSYDECFNILETFSNPITRIKYRMFLDLAHKRLLDNKETI
jgi:predicted  nucleic acid-binding Zn-ribbon protein